MDNILRDTAKNAIRVIIADLGAASVLALLGEVLSEGITTRRGRPTRDEAVNRAIVKGLGPMLPQVITLEGKALNAKAK